MTAVALPGLGIESGAKFSPCRRYRYVLWRTWDPSKAVLVFLMLNPSTANEEDDDATTKKIMRIVANQGYGGIRIVNLFAVRHRNPEILLEMADPIGPDNDRTLREEIARGRTIVCAWGNGGTGKLRALVKLRAIKVMRLLMGAETRALSVTQDGEPGHPLFLSDESVPVVWPEGDR